MTKARLAPIHPGVYLNELLDEFGLTQYRLARDKGRISCISIRGDKWEGFLSTLRLKTPLIAVFLGEVRVRNRIIRC